MRSALEALDKSIRDAWWALKNPDMGGTRVGRAKEILEDARKVARAVLTKVRS